jgi:hypothetical protein
MVIAEYGVDATGYDEIWAIRDSMGTYPLDPHTTDSLTLPQSNLVRAYIYVHSKRNGTTLQISTSEFLFDNNNLNVVQYTQVNIFGPAY